MFRGTFFVFVFCFAALLSGCSSHNVESPVVPGDEPCLESNILHSNRLVLAAGNIRFDPDSMQVDFIPDRNALAHWNGTLLLSPPNCDDCITIEVLEFKPAEKYVKLRIALKNPTQLTVFDVRGIMMSNVSGMKLLNADSYTSLWDDGGGVEINPFKAFAVDWPQREITPYSAHARIYEIEYTTIGDLVGTNVVIDASWPDNCKEPYEIGNSYTTGTFYDFDPQDIFCEVLSWNDDISSVSIDLSCLGMGTDYPMTHVVGNLWSVDDAAWHHGGYGPGTHHALITATCIGTEIPLFNYVDITIDASPPTVGWAKTWGGIGNDHSGGGIALDDDGNIYAAGMFNDTVDFDPGAGVDERVSNGGADVFISKFNSYGDLIWALTWGGSDSDFGSDISIDDSGNIYITGSFQATVDFDPGIGVDERVSNGSFDYFLSKFDSGGAFQWVRVWGGVDWDYDSAVTVDGVGDIYVVGELYDSVDFDPGTGIDIHTSNGEADVFLCKFNSSGDFEGVRTWGGTQPDSGNDVVIDGTGNIYVAGSFRYTVDFDPGPGSYWCSTNGGYDVYMSKFDPDGEFLWVRTWGGHSYDSGYGIAVDNADNTYVTGYFTYLADFDPGPGVDEHNGGWFNDIFLSKFNSDGDFLWARTWGGVREDYGYCVTSGKEGNVYVTGKFRETVDFDPGSGEDLQGSQGFYDVFISKFDTEGLFLWARTFGGHREDNGTGLAVEGDGCIYLTGYWDRTVDFCPGPGVDIHNTNGEWDVFLTKLTPDGNW